MVTPSLSSNLYSHPSRALEDHLIGASKLIDIFLAEKPEPIRNKLSGISHVAALAHDIGKATTYFQDYLRAAKEGQQQQLRSKKTSHSLFSAICAYNVAQTAVDENDFLSPLFVYAVVRRHHGNLIDIMDELSMFQDEDLDLLHTQLDAIEEQSFAILMQKLVAAGLSIFFDKHTIREWIGRFRQELNRLRKHVRRLGPGVTYYVTLNLLYSLLIDADKSDVVLGDPLAFERERIDGDHWVENYLSSAHLPSSPMNSLRMKAYAEASAHPIDLDQRVYSLNLPTGMGKTLTALSFALRLRATLESMRNSPRIIYALPFLSIIDQNSKVFENVIKASGFDPNSRVLLKHHHLSEIMYFDGENEYEPDEAKILIEGWNSEIIVTTFAQLFFALISNKNRNLRKFHRLANSIIILDEVQTIPVRYWHLMNVILRDVANTLNSYVLTSTATEPLLFGSEEPTYLVDKRFYFSTLDRITLVPAIASPITVEELAHREKPKKDRTYLYIFNTIGSAREFYDLVISIGLSTTYLSTHIPPKERLNRIEDIKTGLYKVVVSTQLVEAGVDIDFDVVIRDFAPLDSINQSAGRCNRNGGRRGIVKVVILQDKNGRSFASRVYDGVLLKATEKVLSNRNQISEGEFLGILDEYYSMVSERISQAESKSIVEAVEKLRYDREPGDEEMTSISDFCLISEDYPKVDVFIELDDEAADIWEDFCNLKEIKDRFPRKQKFDSFKADFYKFVISIPTNSPNRPPIVGELGYVSKASLADYYDLERGFILKDERSAVIW
ncbi:MAG: helicase Cas3 [Syntrophorhabdaceae bacterium PtaU1.Bin034]|nr:MAG: helicase Cas3 [Syntrophorhabdaceae bacterium PtaU1.Bin034]